MGERRPGPWFYALSATFAAVVFALWLVGIFDAAMMVFAEAFLAWGVLYSLGIRKVVTISDRVSARIEAVQAWVQGLRWWTKIGLLVGMTVGFAMVYSVVGG